MQINNLDFATILHRFPVNPTDSLMCLFAYVSISASQCRNSTLHTEFMGGFVLVLFVSHGSI